MAKHSSSGHWDDDCQGRIFQRIDVAGEVTITPKVECGPVSVTCLEGRIIPGDLSDSAFRHHSCERKCRVLFVQELLVQVPVEIQVDAECNLTGVRCGEPRLDPSGCLTGNRNGADLSDSSSESGSGSSSRDDDSSGSSDSPCGSGESGSQS